MDNLKIASELVRMAKSLVAGADLYCPNCGENLGKQSEVEDDNDCVRGRRCEIYCSTCGESFKIRPRYSSVAKELMAGEERTAKFPPKAVDYNRVPDADGFWDWELADVKGMSLPSKSHNIGDMIFFLNTAAQTWKRNHG